MCESDLFMVEKKIKIFRNEMKSRERWSNKLDSMREGFVIFRTSILPLDLYVSR